MSILVCIDDNNKIKDTIETAVQLSKDINTDVEFLHVLSPELEKRDGKIQKKHEDNPNNCDAIQKLESVMSDYQTVSFERNIIHSDNGAEVQTAISYIRDVEPEYVLIGHRGLGKKHEEMFGSFTKSLIGELDVPVTVV